MERERIGYHGDKNVVCLADGRLLFKMRPTCRELALAVAPPLVGFAAYLAVLAFVCGLQC